MFEAEALNVRHFCVTPYKLMYFREANDISSIPAGDVTMLVCLPIPHRAPSGCMLELFSVVAFWYMLGVICKKLQFSETS